MNTNNDQKPVFIKKAVLFLLVIIGAMLFASGNAFAASSIKYGWIALDSSKKPVLEGVQYVASKNVKPIAYITNGSVTKPVGNNSVVYLNNTKAGKA